MEIAFEIVASFKGDLEISNVKVTVEEEEQELGQGINGTV